MTLSGGARERRAQTTLDFAVGASVFLIATVFVLAFVPGMLQPFEESTSENNVVADRVASDIVEGQLAEPGEPYILEPDCTRSFFELDDPENTDGGDDGFSYVSSASGCNFEDDPLAKRLGVQGLDENGNDLGIGPNVNVTMIGDFNDVDHPSENDELEILCVDANSDARIIDSAMQESNADGTQCDIVGGDDDFLFAVGPEPPADRGSVAVARRVVSLEGKTAVLIVRVWG